jgi:hypothetical protein
MPATTEAPVRAYAHCVNPRCRGNEQVPVEAIAIETSYFYPETGGDGMFGHPERTTNSLRFADPDEAKCEHCGSHRDLSAQPRMQLDDSGYDRMALLDIAPDSRYNPETAGEVAAQLRAEEDAKRDDEIKELREANAEMRGMMQALLAQQAPTPAEDVPKSDVPEDADE